MTTRPPLAGPLLQLPKHVQEVVIAYGDACARLAALAGATSTVRQPDPTEVRLTMRPMTFDDGRQGWYVDGPGFFCDIEPNDKGQYSIFFRDAKGREGFAMQPDPADSKEAIQRAGKAVAWISSSAMGMLNSISDKGRVSTWLVKTPDEEFTVPLYAAPVPAKEAQPNMFWDHDDAERPYGSISEMLNEYICQCDLEVGALFTIQRAIKLPNINIRVTEIDSEECEAEYEIVPKPSTLKGATE